jgi:hypothetical protein
LQFLESYKSVTLESMAAAFAVGVPFLDQEVSDFIVAGRLGAQIDKVAGIIETKRSVAHCNDSSDPAQQAAMQYFCYSITDLCSLVNCSIALTPCGMVLFCDFWF